MLRIRVRAAAHAASAALLGAMLAACDITIGSAEVTVREEKRFTVSARTALDLGTFDGSIQVNGWDQSEVLVEVVKRGRDQAAVDSITVSAAQADGTIRIDVPRPSVGEAIRWGSSPSASLVVTAPVECTLVARTGDGSITLKRLNGTIDARTVDGSIRISDVKGDLTARTSDGSVRVEAFEGTADIETGDGSLGFEGLVRRLRLDTEDGSVQVKIRAGSVVESDWSVTTGDGTLRIELPERFSAELDAATGDGRVVIDDVRADRTQAERDEGEPRAEREAKDRNRRSAKLTLGSGGKRLTLRTGDGTISIRRW